MQRIRNNKWKIGLGVLGLAGITWAGLTGYNYFTRDKSSTTSNDTGVTNEVDPNLVGNGAPNIQAPEATATTIFTPEPQSETANDIPSGEYADCRIIAPSGEVFIIRKGLPSTVQGHVCVGEYNSNGQTLTVWLANERLFKKDLNEDGDLNDYVRRELSR